jgi:hypothetical protein
VKVDLTTTVTLPFINFFTQAPMGLAATATAALVTTGQYCMVSLYNGTDPGISAGGNANLGLGCGMITNSRAANAFNAYGSAEVDASPIAAVGGVRGDSHFSDGTVLQPYTSPMADPFGSVPNWTVPSGCSAGALSVGNGDSVTLSDTTGYCFASADIKGTLTIPAGKTLTINNGLLDLKGRITGSDVMIALMGNSSDFKQNGGGVLDIDGRTDGPYKGIAMYRDRTATNVTIKINGGADTDVTGAFYLPSSDVWIGGNANITASCLQVVGQKLDFKGGGSITNTCTPTSGASAFNQYVVRLVV